jgi:hypothetical protein
MESSWISVEVEVAQSICRDDMKYRRRRGRSGCDIRVARISGSECGRLVDDFSVWFVFIDDHQFNGADRLAAEVLVAVNGASRNVDHIAGLQDLRLFASNRVGDLAFLHHFPLIAGMAVEWGCAAGRD